MSIDIEAERCETCDGKGWLHTLNAERGAMEIQRCDGCSVFMTDEKALEHVVLLANAAPELLQACIKAVEPLSEGEDCGLSGDTYNFVCDAIKRAEEV